MYETNCLLNIIFVIWESEALVNYPHLDSIHGFTQKLDIQIAHPRVLLTDDFVLFRVAPRDPNVLKLYSLISAPLPEMYK